MPALPLLHPLALLAAAASALAQPQPPSTPPPAPELPAADPGKDVVIRNATRGWTLALPAGWSAGTTETVAAMDAAMSEVFPEKGFTCVAVFFADAARGPTGPNIQVHEIPGGYGDASFEEIERELADRAARERDRRREREAAGALIDDVTESEPTLDRERRRIVTDGAIRLPDGQSLRFRTTAMLGKRGLTKLLFYAPEAEFAAAQPAYDALLSSFAFDAAAAYTPPPPSFFSASNLTRGAGSLVAVILIVVIIRSSFRKKNPIAH